MTDIAHIARAVESAGADALSLINTAVGMSIDIRTRRPRLANVTGGLSGPAIKPIAVRCVYQASNAVKIPLIGIGGIATVEDALEFIDRWSERGSGRNSELLRPERGHQDSRRARRVLQGERTGEYQRDCRKRGRVKCEIHL